MKRSLFTFILTTSIAVSSFAQWSNSGGVVYTSNSVGIGTSSPTSLLQIGNITTSPGATTTPTLVTMDDTYGTNPIGSNFKLKLYQDAGTSSYGFGISNALLEIIAGQGGGMSFFTNRNVQAMSILPNGNIGIGTATPQESLSVNGSIRARQITVQTTNWPDFVFKRGYALMPLSEVKTYIDQSGHLPGVPTEQETTSKGINLGLIDQILTQKVEELTLYLIQQQRANELLERRLNELEEQVGILRQSKCN